MSHIERENKVAKFWIEPVRLSRSGGFNSHELNNIQRHVSDNKELIIKKRLFDFSDSIFLFN